MADDDQQPPQQRYWFPYWTSPPQPAPRPALRQQPSRRDSRAAPAPSPPVAPSPSRRQTQPPAAASRGSGGGGAVSPPQPTRLSSRPSPSRAPPLSPIREPNVSAPPASAPASGPNKEPKPAVKQAILPRPAAREEAPKELDIIVPQEKIIHEPPSETKTQNKAVEKEKEKVKDKEGKEKKDKEKQKEHKEKEKDKDHKDKKEKEKDHKEKEKDKDHKEKKEKETDHKEKEKDKDHKEKEKDKQHKKEAESKEHDEPKVHGGKLHKELKAGVADMVHKLGASATPSAGHAQERHATGAAGTTVITLAGENKGASMNVVSHAESKDAAGKEHRAARKVDEGKHEAQRGAKGLTTFVNSNVQVMNNSLMLHSSCNSGNPGVHLKLFTKSKKKSDGEDAGGKGKGGSTVAVKK